MAFSFRLVYAPMLEVRSLNLRRGKHMKCYGEYVRFPVEKVSRFSDRSEIPSRLKSFVLNTIQEGHRHSSYIAKSSNENMAYIVNNRILSFSSANS